jgi:hypothetical protein
MILHFVYYVKNTKLNQLWKNTMPTRVQYDGKRLIPAPTVDVQRNFNLSADGTILGTSFTITLNGTMIAYKGSPDSSGTLWTAGGYPPDETITHDSRLGSIIRKQEAIRGLFSVNGKSMEIQSADGSQPMKFYPTITSINIPQGLWYQQAPYTITMEATCILPEQDDCQTVNVETASENWSFETNDQEVESVEIPRSYRATHNISAQGKTTYKSTGDVLKYGWELARDFCLLREGFDTSYLSLPSGIEDLSNFQALNHVRGENTDELNGSFSLSETWIVASGTAHESFNVDTTTNNSDGLTNVSIAGTIKGLELRDGSMELITSKYDNASSKLATSQPQFYTRAQTYSGVTLNILPTNTSIGKNVAAGVINYSFNYDTKPTTCISGARTESITITDLGKSEVFAAIPVLGRSVGPVLQNIGTSEATTRALTIEVSFAPVVKAGCTFSDIAVALSGTPLTNPNTSGDILNIINAVNPDYQGASQVFKGQPQETWEPLTGRYSYNQEWTYEQ